MADLFMEFSHPLDALYDSSGLLAFLTLFGSHRHLGTHSTFYGLATVDLAVDYKGNLRNRCSYNERARHFSEMAALGIVLWT